MRSELPRGMAELTGTAGLLTPNRGEKPAGLNLPWCPLCLCGSEGDDRDDLLLLRMLSHNGGLVFFRLGAVFRPQTWTQGGILVLIRQGLSL